jgi:hypothetical protein
VCHFHLFPVAHSAPCTIIAIRRAATTDDAAFALHQSLCAFVFTLKKFVPTAQCSELRATLDAEWASGLLVTAHSTDVEDVMLLAQKRGFVDCVSAVASDDILMSACYPAWASDLDAGSCFYVAKQQLSRAIEIGDGARSELLVVDSGMITAIRARESAPFLEPCGIINAGGSSELAAPHHEDTQGAMPVSSSSVSASALMHVFPELCVGVPLSEYDRMSRKASLLRSLLPGVVIHVYALIEESLLKHFPGVGLGRLRVASDTTMVSNAPGHPRTSEARIAATSRIGVPYMKACAITDSRLPLTPEAIGVDASRSCSMGAALQIGEGVTSTVTFISSGHDLELSLIGNVSLEVSRSALEEQGAVPRDGIALHALTCVNPGPLSHHAMPCGEFIESLRAEPGASADLAEPLWGAADLSRIACDIALYGINAGPDVPSYETADFELLPHLAGSLPVNFRGIARDVPCLPPFGK